MTHRAPTFTRTFPRNVRSSTTSTSSAPGRQPTTRRGSTRYAQTAAAGACTMNRSSTSIAIAILLPGGARPPGSRTARARSPGGSAPPAPAGRPPGPAKAPSGGGPPARSMATRRAWTSPSSAALRPIAPRASAAAAARHSRHPRTRWASASTRPPRSRRSSDHLVPAEWIVAVARSRPAPRAGLPRPPTRPAAAAHRGRGPRSPGRRRVRAAQPRHHLGQDGDRDLAGRAGPDVDPHRPVDARQGGGVEARRRRAAPAGPPASSSNRAPRRRRHSERSAAASAGSSILGSCVMATSAVRRSSAACARASSGHAVTSADAAEALRRGVGPPGIDHQDVVPAQLHHGRERLGDVHRPHDHHPHRRVEDAQEHAPRRRSRAGAPGPPPPRPARRSAAPRLPPPARTDRTGADHLGAPSSRARWPAPPAAWPSDRSRTSVRTSRFIPPAPRTPGWSRRRPAPPPRPARRSRRTRAAAAPRRG